MHANPSATIPRDRRVRLTEVYASIQGESTHVGKPCVFIRLTGCNLRCRWCDSEFTFKGGAWHDLDDVVEKASAYGIHTVEITGGEPLLQPSVIPLMQALLDRGHEVLIETSGSRDISAIPDAVHIILDLKAPDSGEVESNLWSNLDHLKENDEIKIVIASRGDYEWAAETIRSRALHTRCGAVLLSPAWGEIEPQHLVEWMLEDQLPARLQLQIHKVIWPPEARGV